MILVDATLGIKETACIHLDDKLAFTMETVSVTSLYEQQLYASVTPSLSL